MMSRSKAYYNEKRPNGGSLASIADCCGLIPHGTVDERSITEVQPYDLEEFTQCHFFAGIGGWSRALDLAQWPADVCVWTGSCPCQPFSAAGKQKGTGDDRHLWPEFFRLIKHCRPNTVFGEQVEGAIKHGWLDDLSADLEGEGYTVGAAVLGAHSVNAPHIRQRLYWVADYTGIKGGKRYDTAMQRGWKVDTKQAGMGSSTDWVADSASLPRAQHEREPRRRTQATEHAAINSCDRQRLVNSISTRSQRHSGMSTEATNPDGSTRTRNDQLPRQAVPAGWRHRTPTLAAVLSAH